MAKECAQRGGEGGEVKGKKRIGAVGVVLEWVEVYCRKREREGGRVGESRVVCGSC